MRFPTTVLATALLAACGGGDATEPTAVTPAEPRLPTSVQVTTFASSESGPFRFAPDDVTLALGGSVTWSVPGAAGVIRHSVTADSGGWVADTLAAGQTLTLTFDKRGDFRYNCVFHDGMVGKISVR